MRVNVEALYTVTREIVPAMVERRRRGVLNIASIVALQAIPYWTKYAATKASANGPAEAPGRAEFCVHYGDNKDTTNVA